MKYNNEIRMKNKYMLNMLFSNLIFPYGISEYYSEETTNINPGIQSTSS